MSGYKLIPATNRILLERDGVSEKTFSGMDIPTSALKRPLIGTVKAVGPDVKTVSEGDRVIFADGMQTSAEFEGEELTYIREVDVHFIIKSNS